MIPRLITSSVLAAIAGAAMALAVPSSPSFAFTLSSPSVTEQGFKTDLQEIYYYRRYYYRPLSSLLPSLLSPLLSSLLLSSLLPSLLSSVLLPLLSSILLPSLLLPPLLLPIILTSLARLLVDRLRTRAPFDRSRGARTWTTYRSVVRRSDPPPPVAVGIAADGPPAATDVASPIHLRRYRRWGRRFCPGECSPPCSSNRT